MYSYENDPLYPKTYLTIEQIEAAQNRAKRLRAQMFLSMLEGLFANHMPTKNKPVENHQVQLSSSKGFA